MLDVALGFADVGESFIAARRNAEGRVKGELAFQATTGCRIGCVSCCCCCCFLLGNAFIGDSFISDIFIVAGDAVERHLELDILDAVVFGFGRRWRVLVDLFARDADVVSETADQILITLPLITS